MNHLFNNLDSHLNDHLRPVVPEPITECPNCCMDIESENELISFHSRILNKNILACIECKQFEDNNN